MTNSLELELQIKRIGISKKRTCKKAWYQQNEPI